MAIISDSPLARDRIQQTRAIEAIRDIEKPVALET